MRGWAGRNSDGCSLFDSVGGIPCPPGGRKFKGFVSILLLDLFVSVRDFHLVNDLRINKDGWKREKINVDKTETHKIDIQIRLGRVHR